MKLKIEPRPPEYTADKAIVLTNVDNDDNILIGCPNAGAVAREIRRAVNFHDSLVAALTPFRSEEMGQMLLDLILADAPPGVSDEHMNQVHGRLSLLINAIDVTLKGIELMRERDEEWTKTME